MTTEILLPMVFGFGVLTLATVALLNAAGHRLHELQVTDQQGPRFAFAYTYGSKAAAELRLSFWRLPFRLGSGAVVVVLATYGLFMWAEMASPPPPLIEMISWVTIGTYVLFLVVWTTSLSARLYNAMSRFERGPLPRQANTGQG